MFMKLLKISFFIFVLSLFNLVSALDAPTNIILDKAGENGLEISWDSVTWAEVYAISYWKKSAWTGSYEHELEIVVNDDAKTKIEKLDLDTKYYIAIKAYDSNENESEYSEEVTFSTLDELLELKINNLKIINTKQLNLEFNVDIKEDSLVDVNIIDLWDDLVDIEVERYTVSGNKLDLFLVAELKKEEKYSITIVTLEWKLGEKIKSWVDGIIDFEVTEEVGNVEENSIEETELNSADNEEFTSTWSEDSSTESSNNMDENTVTQDGDTLTIEGNNTDTENNKVLGWKDVDLENSKTLEGVAKDNKALPTTGPAETFLFLLFSLIAWGLFLSLRRKIKA